MTDPGERIRALMSCLDEETAADIEAVILHRHAGRVLGLHALVQELRNAGLATQADELLERINAAAPQPVALPPPPQLPAATNGAPTSPLPVRRRGRPPKIGGEQKP